MKVFGIKLEKALPYLLGGAFLLWLVSRGRNVAFIEEKILSTKIKFSFMSDKEKKRYAKEQADLIGDILGLRIFSSWRNNDDIVAIVKGNNFCIQMIGKAFNCWYKPLPLSAFLTISLSSNDLIKISEELQLLQDIGE